MRSAGITDLRHGNLLDEDWVEGDRFERGADRRRHLPLPDKLRCYAAAASMGKPDRRLEGPPCSATDWCRWTARSVATPNPKRTLALTENRQWVAHGMNHMELLSRAEVYAQLRHWLS